MIIAALFVRPDSVYKMLPGVDAWDAQRDARNWPGGTPLVAHPPCAQWGTLRHLARNNPDEKALALLAVRWVQRYGGILEHPKRSTLWPAARLPAPGDAPDEFGGYTLAVSQLWWGHRAEKKTLLYVVGCPFEFIPPIQIALLPPVALCGTSGRRKNGRRVTGLPEITKAEREHTHLAFAELPRSPRLRRCGVRCAHRRPHGIAL